MTEPKRVSLVWLMIAAFLMVAIVFNEAYADDHKCQGGHNCNDGGSLTGGDNTAIISGSRSYGLSGGDMDIRDCLATHSVLFGLWQGTHINAMCEATNMDRDGNYQGAAEMRCSTRKYRRTYGKGQKCIDAIIRTAPPTIEPVIYEDDDEDDLEPIYARLIDLEAQRQSDADNARKAAIRANTAARQAEQAETLRQEYAQQMYEELKEWN